MPRGGALASSIASLCPSEPGPSLVLPYDLAQTPLSPEAPPPEHQALAVPSSQGLLCLSNWRVPDPC